MTALFHPAFRPIAQRGRGPALLRLLAVVAAHVVLGAIIVHLDPDLRRQVEPVLVSLITPPKPIEPLPPPPVRTAVPKAVAKAPPAPAPAPPTPVEMPSPAAITQEAPPPAPAAPVAPAPIRAEPPAAIAAPKPVTVTPPSFDAAYLNNPRPEYPRAARRLGEHGKVVLRVYVSAQGAAEKVEVGTSSGSSRLDHAAREAVEKWRFTPARRGEETVGAWVLVPITFMLEG